MRRVYIQKDHDDELANENCFKAYDGFKKLGFEIYFYVDYPPINLDKEDIVVGYIGSVKQALKNLDIEVPEELDYPIELEKYFGRKIEKSTLEFVSNDVDNYPYFIKPVMGKMFDGRVVKSFKDLIGTKSQSIGKTEIWKSDIVEFVTEWRVFVRYGKVLDARHYKGDCFQQLDKDVVLDAINIFKSQPNAYSLDIGLTKEGQYLLVECNSGYSLGSYGLFSVEYAKLISAKWADMTNTDDVIGYL